MKASCGFWISTAAGAAALAAVGCGGQSASGAAHVAAAAGILQLRAVSSSSYGTCRAQPLTTPPGGTACGLDAQTTYELGPSLGDLVVSRARVVVDPQTNDQVVAVDVDRRSSTTLEDVTARSIGNRLAILLNGRVAMAATIQGPLDSGEIQLDSGNPAAVAEIAASLHATPASPDDVGGDTSGDFSPPAAQDVNKQLAVCRDHQPSAAAGMHLDTTIVNTALQTAASAARWMSDLGDRAAASVWSHQPADEQVFVCGYAGPKPEHETIPSCPPGQTPVVDDLGRVRAFLVDEHSHATDLSMPNPTDTSGCSPG